MANVMCGEKGKDREMDIQIGDVWGSDEFIYEIVGYATDGFGYKCTYTTDGYTSYNSANSEYIMKNTKLMSRMVDGKRIDRPEADQYCTLDECIIFELGTDDEWNALACKGTVTLDDNGELPKPKRTRKMYSWGDACKIAEKNRGLIMETINLKFVISAFFFTEDGDMLIPDAGNFYPKSAHICAKWSIRKEK